MKTCLYVRIATVIALLLLPALGLCRRMQPSPKFGSSSLPAPPKQSAAWTAPANSPAELVSAAQTLFEQGMADPRGCDYSEVEIATGNCWNGDGGVIKAHGWVLPAKPGETQRFAVAWNGLVYPVIKIGPKADIHSDVARIIKADNDSRAAEKKRYPDSAFSRYRSANSEGETITPAYLDLLQACMLLRLGNSQLADQIWKTCYIDPNEKPQNAYFMLATEWTWSLYDRAVNAHMRGDDALAFASASALKPVQPLVEAECAQRGYKKTEYSDSDRRGQFAPYMPFITQLDLLIADSQRRLNEKPQTEPLATATQAERIAGLINKLDQVAERQWGQPGGVMLGMNPTIKALIAEGNAAIEPLIECVEKDSRLTRSVGFHRDFFRSRHAYAVWETACEALSQILHADELSYYSLYAIGDGPASSKARADKIREYLRKYSAGSISARSYAILADDNAKPKMWLQAAGQITHTVDPGETPIADRKPTVPELMLKRIEIMSQNHEGGDWAYSFEKACDMTLVLAAWDKPLGIATVNKQVDRCIARYKLSIYYQEGPYIARMTDALIGWQDPNALERYAKWVQTTGPRDLRDTAYDTYSLLIKYQDKPAIADAARWLFTDPASPWNTIPTREIENYVASLTEKSIISLEPFRALVLKKLADKTQQGVVKMLSEGSMERRYGGDRIRSQVTPDAFTLKVNVDSPIRLCDDYAIRMSERLIGAPEFRYEWTIEKRDEIIGKMAALLKQYGGRYDGSAIYSNSSPFWGWLMPVFSPLDHPASKEDVTRGLAIFSLDGKARLKPMPKRPLIAKWTTQKNYPVQQSYIDPKTGKKAIYYDQDGLVWQAEEVLKDGKWETYYGFVGRHYLAKVLAGEIEFPKEQ